MGKGHVPMPSRVKEARLSQPRPVSGAAREGESPGTRQIRVSKFGVLKSK